MANNLLESSAVSAFCESVAVMMAAGIQTDEAVHLLGEKMQEAHFKRVCDKLYKSLTQGKNLASAMEESHAFPSHVVHMVRTGETSGRTENVLRSLAVYYDEEARIFDKVRTSIGYPAALLCIMTIILAFTVAIILPVFIDVYESLSGSLTSGSFSAVSASIAIGWVALILTLICTILALAVMFATRTERGRLAVMKIMEKLPGTKGAMYQLALSRFTSVVATHIASGMNEDNAMKEAIATVDHAGLRKKLEPAYASMMNLDDPKNLAQAIYDNNVYEPVYARMLMVGSRSGSTDDVLGHLSAVFFEDAISQLDRTIDSIEPILAAFMTIAVGATLISVMLPLIGIMGSIG